MTRAALLAALALALAAVRIEPDGVELLGAGGGSAR